MMTPGGRASHWSAGLKPGLLLADSRELTKVRTSQLTGPHLGQQQPQPSWNREQAEIRTGDSYIKNKEYVKPEKIRPILVAKGFLLLSSFVILIFYIPQYT